jgi:hypothetical protein
MTRNPISDNLDIQYLDKSTSWYQHGLLHRVNGAAVEHKDGTKEWYYNGLRHRTDGAAIEYNDGSSDWYQNGQLHRLTGPAMECSIEKQQFNKWFINSVLQTPEQVQLLAFINGIKYCTTVIP